MKWVWIVNHISPSKLIIPSNKLGHIPDVEDQEEYEFYKYKIMKYFRRKKTILVFSLDYEEAFY